MKVAHQNGLLKRTYVALARKGATTRTSRNQKPISRRGEARTDVANLNVARKFDELAHEGRELGAQVYAVQALELACPHMATPSRFWSGPSMSSSPAP